VKTLESKETKASKEITVTHNSVFAAHRLQCRMTTRKNRHPAFSFAGTICPGRSGDFAYALGTSEFGERSSLNHTTTVTIKNTAVTTMLLKGEFIVFVPFATCFLFSLPLGATFLTSHELSYAAE
jgi:hypothetical protein